MPQVASLEVEEIARRVDGTLIGEANSTVTGVCSLEDPQTGCIAFCSAKESKDIRSRVTDSKLAAVLVDDSVADEALADSVIPFIKVAKPQQALMSLLSVFHPPVSLPTEVHSSAIVAESAILGKDVAVAPLAVIGENVTLADGVQIHPHVVLYQDVTIGKNSIVHAGAVVREGTIIGENCVIQSGSIIGADGFGYIPDSNGKLKSVPQVGIVELSDNVDIGANACVDRAALGTTRIGVGSKVDNLVQIGHNVQIGASSILCGQVGIGGSTKIGNGVVLGGQAGVADHVTIVDGVRAGGNSGIEGNILEKGDYMGFPLLPASKWRRVRARFGALPDLLRSFKSQQKQG